MAAGSGAMRLGVIPEQVQRVLEAARWVVRPRRGEVVTGSCRSMER